MIASSLGYGGGAPACSVARHLTRKLIFIKPERERAWQIVVNVNIAKRGP